MVSVQRLSARAQLDDSQEALSRAQSGAAAGDESWHEWLAEYGRGEALILRLELTVELADCEEAPLRSSSGGFFIESDVHAPNVEQQIAEHASGEFVALADILAARGGRISAYELGEMYVHVELDDEVRRLLAGAPPAALTRCSGP